MSQRLRLSLLSVLFALSLSACSKSNPTQGQDVIRDRRVEDRIRDGQELGAKREQQERANQSAADRQTRQDGGNNNLGGSRKTVDRSDSRGNSGDEEEDADEDRNISLNSRYNIGSGSKNSWGTYAALLGLGLFQGLGGMMTSLGDWFSGGSRDAGTPAAPASSSVGMPAGASGQIRTDVPREAPANSNPATPGAASAPAPVAPASAPADPTTTPTVEATLNVPTPTPGSENAAPVTQAAPTDEASGPQVLSSGITREEVIVNGQKVIRFSVAGQTPITPSTDDAPAAAGATLAANSGAAASTNAAAPQAEDSALCHLDHNGVDPRLTATLGQIIDSAIAPRGGE